MLFLTLHDVLVSSIRWGLGVFLGIAAGCLVGAILSIRKRSAVALFTAANFLRAVPILGLVPLFQFYFGVNEFSKVGLIAWAVAFPVAFALRKAMQPLDTDTELMLSLGSQNYAIKFRYVVFPRVWEALSRSVQVAIGLGWLVVVASEMIGSFSQGFWRGGLGYQLFRAYEYNRPYDMLLILAAFGLLGVASSALWTFVTQNAGADNDN